MALLQGILALITRSLGSLFNTAFGWAVTALFGRTTPKEKTLLSVVVGTAAAWPLLVAGVFLPKLATFLVALVPLSSDVPSWAVRPVWIFLALVVPAAVGIALHVSSPRKRPLWLDAVAGFRITVGLALSFAFNLISAPTLRIWSILHRRTDEHLLAIVEPGHYGVVALGLERAWGMQRLGLASAPPPVWQTFPTRILNRIAGQVFQRYVPDDPAYFHGAELEAALYPTDLLLRGRPDQVAQAALSAGEALLGLPVLQTIDPRAQALERRIKESLRPALGGPHQRPEQHWNKVHELAAQLRKSPIPLKDACVIYRELLQLSRVAEGRAQLLEELIEHAPKGSQIPVRGGISRPRAGAHDLEPGG